MVIIEQIITKFIDFSWHIFIALGFHANYFMVISWIHGKIMALHILLNINES